MKRITVLILVLCLTLSLSAGVSAAGQKQYDYSTKANSGVRYEICNSLLGTSVDTYYTGSYTYENLSDLSGNELLNALRSLMTDTHTYNTSYDDCHYKANLTDCENADGTSISLIYTGYSATQADWCNTRDGGWNREHVWPKSLGGFGESGAGADLHHIRPSDATVNSTRGNKKYGNVDGGKAANSTSYIGTVGGYYSSSYFEPLDNVKGDVARICLYVYVRYGGELSKCSSITNVFQSVDVLLEWCALDPVDTWEMGRNEVVAGIQGNRNVFIDYPELAWKLFNKEMPDNVATPSNGLGVNMQTCLHKNTTAKNAASATCTQAGYTGDTYCNDCGKTIASGTTITATGHANENGDNLCDTCGEKVTCKHGKTERKDAVEADCVHVGYSGDVYCVYCTSLVEKGAAIAATGQHHWEDTENGQRCSVCGKTEDTTPTTEPTQPPVTEPPATEPPATELPATEPLVTEPSATQPPATQSPTTEPTEGETTVPSADPTQPTTTKPVEEPEPDYGWLVFVVIGAMACACILTVAFRAKKNQK